MSLSLGLLRRGIHAGGHEFSVSAKQILQVIERYSEANNVSTSSLLNVLFDLPGDLDRPSYAGQRYGRMSKRQSTLQIETAVPSEVLIAQNGQEFMLSSLRSAVAMGSQLFADKGLAFDVNQHLRLIDDVEAELTRIK